MLLLRQRLRAVGRVLVALTVFSLISQLTIPYVAAAPILQDDDEVTDGYLNRLLGEINARRHALGTQSLVYVPRHANDALDGYLQDAAPAMAWPGPCGHGITGAFAWDYVLAAGFWGEARGEVIACPGPEPYWTPNRAAETWWSSPYHFGVLYGDPDANAIACGAYGTQGGGSKKKRNNTGGDAAIAVVCVTFRG
ncbi:MAG: hypothetical protein IT307_16790 [Chloroflexi bacterium]|nr:hypothetical protein [Chloroflexota bacterium]